MKITNKKLLVSGLAALMAGCSTANLAAVPQNRDSYNRALDASENEQFLLSVVRMHYAEMPYFVSVDSITATTTLRTGVRGNIGVNNIWATPQNGLAWTVAPDIGFTQSPTITYSPNQGAKFATGMLAPLTMGKIFLLTQSGYSPSEVMKLTMNRIGSLLNGGIASDHAGAKQLPDTTAFDNHIALLDKLGATNQIKIDYASYESSGAIYMSFSNPEAAASVAKSLGLSKSYKQLIFSNLLPDSTHPENVISVYPRSYFNIVNFLARNIDTPKSSAGSSESVNYAATLVDSSVDWSPYSKNLLHVLTSTSEPSSKAVAKTEYNNNWYYIADNDQVSKSTLVILKLIYSLQMGEVDANLPIITIPVN